MKEKFNNQFATQKLRENEAPGEEFIVNKVWDFLETKPFANPDYMPKFKTAEEIYNDFDEDMLKKYSEFDWKGDTEPIHRNEKAALQRRANYDKLAGTSDYMKHRQDPEYYEKEFQKAGTSDYFQRRGMDETSATGAGANFVPGTGEQLATPRAFKKVKKEAKDVEPKLAAGKAKIYAKEKWGWKEAPSIPNRPSKGGFIYKQLFEGLAEEANEAEWPREVPSRHGEYIFKLVKATPDGAMYDVIDRETGKKEPGGRAYGSVETLKNAAADLVKPKGGTLSTQLEENYSRFKKETKTRTNEQQFHTAMRLAEKKIHEANRILEYTAQLKSELSVIKENKNTQKLMEKITRGIAEAYGKMKKLK